jgi:hypothetical protein
MASHTVAAGGTGKGFTLTASTVDTVTFNEYAPVVEVINRDGAAEVWYTLDGSTPTVNGDNCYLLPATTAVDSRKPGSISGSVVVKLISSGTPSVRVQRGA